MNAYGGSMIYPVFGGENAYDEEDYNLMYYGFYPSENGIITGTAGSKFWPQQTLRLRAFVRLLRYVDTEHISLQVNVSQYKDYVFNPKDLELETVIKECYRNKVVRMSLSNLPLIYNPQIKSRDPELVSSLQDLADILAEEIKSAFVDDYYPGIDSVKPLSKRHIKNIMVAMQREIDREAAAPYRDNVHAPQLLDLPYDRQVALAERRRYWFREVFGITPTRWKKGIWSLWKVKDIPMPYTKYYSL